MLHVMYAKQIIEPIFYAETINCDKYWDQYLQNSLRSSQKRNNDVHVISARFSKCPHRWQFSKFMTSTVTSSYTMKILFME
jgi:hypothetical protein